MRYSEIAPPRTHPYIVSRNVDPVDYQSLQRVIDNRPELRLINCDDSEPDQWVVRIGCASRAVASAVGDWE
jgi:hypothetical protein